MTDFTHSAATFVFDVATRALVRLSARIAAGSELDVRQGLTETAAAATPARWVEELILQSYLFAGFPRALNAAREWRRGVRELQGGKEFGVAGAGEGGEVGEEELRLMGEATCARVYGGFYSTLRHNIAELHFKLDDWMINEGYGKVLSRPGLDLGRRELCIVAACVAAGQDRQLHSHLYGARNVGAPDEVISQALEALEGVVVEEHWQRAKLLWVKVRR